jgi:hypothetical protein
VRPAFADLLNQEGVRLRGTATTDVYGATEYDFTSPTTATYDCRVSSGTGAEPEEVGRSSTERTWLLHLPPTADVVANDRFTVGDKTYQVDGPPVIVRDRNSDHHLKAKLRLVEG